MTLFLIFIINLVSTTIFDDKYSGIAIFISLGVFIIGNAFFINAKQLIISERE